MQRLSSSLSSTRLVIVAPLSPGLSLVPSSRTFIHSFRADSVFVTVVSSLTPWKRRRRWFSPSIPAQNIPSLCKRVRNPVAFTGRDAATLSLNMAEEGKPGVVMMLPFFQYLLDAIESKFTLFKLWEADDELVFLKENADKIRGLVGSASIGASAEVIDALPNLEIVSSFSVGTDKVDLRKCRERGIVVTNTPDVLTDETADTALALMLTTMRRICAADRYVREGLWPIKGHYPLAYKFSGKRLGIVGLGRIGLAIAKRAEGFNCSISYYSRSRKSEVAFQYFDSVLELAKNSDILVIACALTKETTHLVNRDVLNALGPNGTLVNVARGAVVDEPELVKALVEGRLGAAGLDVFENEPCIPKELLSMDNVVLQPHVGSATWETRKAMADLVVSNLEAHFSGKPLLTSVT